MLPVSQIDLVKLFLNRNPQIQELVPISQVYPINRSIRPGELRDKQDKSSGEFCMFVQVDAENLQERRFSNVK